VCYNSSMENNVRFIKSRDNRVFTGILGGLAAYLGLSPRLLRVCFFLIVWTFNWMAVIYFILMFVMPEENESYEEAGSFISNLNLPTPVKTVLSRFWSSWTEMCSVLFKD